MIDEEYRGYNLTAVRHGGMWQVSIYPLSVGQIVPKPRGRRAAQAVAISPSSSGVVTLGRKGRPRSTVTADDQAAPPPVAA